MRICSKAKMYGTGLVDTMQRVDERGYHISLIVFAIREQHAQ